MSEPRQFNSDFQQLLEELQPTLEELEEKRLMTLLTLLAVWGVFLLLWGKFCFAPLGEVEITKESLKTFFVVAIPFCPFAYWIITYFFRRDFKQQILRRFIALIDPTFSYDPEFSVPESDYLESELFKKAHERYRGEDCVSGRIGDTELTFSEVHTTYTRGSGRNKQTVTVFRGLFAVADFHRNFQGSIYILPDMAESMLGTWGQDLQAMNPTHGQLVRLEDPEFEQYFVVYASNQISSRYILSTSMMQRITEFRKRAGVKVSMAFKQSKVYIAVHHNRDLFEPSLLKSLEDTSTLEGYMDELELFMGIVDDLNLNLNIWDSPHKKAM